jgi:hypothetical protein
MNATRVLALFLLLSVPLTLTACGDNDDREIENGQQSDDDDDDEEDD